MYVLKAYINATGDFRPYVLTHDVKRGLQESKGSSGLIQILSTQATTSVVLLENDVKLAQLFMEEQKRRFAQLLDQEVNRRSLTGPARYHFMAAQTGLSLILPFERQRLLVSVHHEIYALDFEPKAGRREFVIVVYVQGEKK